MVRIPTIWILEGLRLINLFFFIGGIVGGLALLVALALVVFFYPT
jgi:hypothetical protein